MYVHKEDLNELILKEITLDEFLKKFFEDDYKNLIRGLPRKTIEEIYKILIMNSKEIINKKIDSSDLSINLLAKLDEIIKRYYEINKIEERKNEEDYHNKYDEHTIKEILCAKSLSSRFINAICYGYSENFISRGF